MDYIELTVPVRDTLHAEILTAYLAEFPFESFAEEPSLLKAYIPAEALAGCKADVDALLRREGVEGTYIEIEPVNWNALWESNFEPVEIEGGCVIRAPFHAPRHDARVEVVIMPKMSFGTGHHATTHLVAGEMLRRDYTGLRGLDMGSGTGVLAILAVKLGAAHVDAIDIDEWAYENCCENIAENGVSERVTPLLGDVRLLSGRSYDFILANINRNILLADVPAYAAVLKPGGTLTVSGILTADIPAIVACAAAAGLTPAGESHRDGWAALVFER